MQSFKNKTKFIKKELFWKEINFTQLFHVTVTSVVHPIIVEIIGFWQTLPLYLEQKSGYAKSNCLKILYKLYVISVEQQISCCSNKQWKLQSKCKRYYCIGKKWKRTKVEQLICLESPLLSIDPEISTQVVRTNFLAFCFWHTKYEFENKGKQRIILKTSKYSFFALISSYRDANRGTSFYKTFKLWVECAINRTRKNWYEYCTLVCQHYLIRFSGEYVYTFNWIYIICMIHDKL